MGGDCQTISLKTVVERRSAYGWRIGLSSDCMRQHAPGYEGGNNRHECDYQKPHKASPEVGLSRVSPSMCENRAILRFPV